MEAAIRCLKAFAASEAFKSAKSDLIHGVPRLLIFFCGVKLTNDHILTVVQTYGPSMLPTLALAGNVCLAERLSARFHKLRAGDIVLVRSPEAPRKVATKRLMAMEGESVTYIVDPKRNRIEKSETIVVPKGCVWVEGDNIYDSRDSRNFGPVPYGLLQGRLFWREDANQAASTSVSDISVVKEVVVEDEEPAEVEVDHHRVFLLGENRWEDSSRLIRNKKGTESNTTGIPTKCLTCRGEGRLLCSECDGTGEPNIEEQFMEWIDGAKCPYCEGLGYTICDVCGGN